MGVLSHERRGAIAVVTLDRPHKRNALSIELREELRAAFEELAADGEIACVVLTGRGTAFCSGMDVTEFGGDAAHKRRLVETSTGAFHAVGRCPVPTIAAVNGPALAGGFALALLCDVRVAGPEATFGFAEPPGIAASYASIRAVAGPGVARELAITGRVLDAPEALARGIVAQVATAEQGALALAVGLAERVAARPRAVMLETKRRILLDADRSFAALMADEEETFRRALLGAERP